MTAPAKDDDVREVLTDLVDNVFDYFATTKEIVNALLSDPRIEIHKSKDDDTRKTVDRIFQDWTVLSPGGFPQFDTALDVLFDQFEIHKRPEAISR